MTKCRVEISMQAVSAQDANKEITWYNCSEQTYEGNTYRFKSSIKCDDIEPYQCVYCGENCLTSSSLALHESNCVQNKVSDLADLSDLVYNKFGKECETINGWVNVSGEITWEDLTYYDKSCGYEAAMFVRVDERGIRREYAFVTAGTNIFSLNDWATDLYQLIAATCQYSHAESNASKIHERAKLPVTYAGHSLGGGLASASALASGSPAVTFNAAGLSSATKNAFNLNKSNKNINAYIVDGDIVDNLQGKIGITAEGRHHNLSNCVPAPQIYPPVTLAPQVSAQIIANEIVVSGTAGVVNHTMYAVKNGLSDGNIY